MSTDPLTLPSLLRHNSETYGDKPAIVDESESIGHDALDRASANLAGRLVRSGIGPSSRVGLVMENGIDWVITATAVMRIGAVLVPLSTLLKPPELRGQLQTARVTELIVTEEFRGRTYLDELESIAPGVVDSTRAGRRHVALPNLRGIWTANDLPSDRVDAAMVTTLEAAVRPSNDLVILFTSGSRGTPKGVIHTHGGAIRATASGLGSRCVSADERLYIPMPFFWTGGFSGGLMTVLVAGATLITEAIPEPATTLALLEREKVTLFRGWPDQAARLAADPMAASTDLRSLGPASLPAMLPADRRPKQNPRANLFGMTETFGPYCGDRLDTDLPPGKHGSCGRPFVGIEVRVVDPESGSSCPPGVDGEIAVRGPHVMRGICGRSRSATFDKDAYYRTGDLGMLDADGYLWFRGRTDDMFKVNGATVYPSEVEAALREVPGVILACVTDVPGPDGSRVGALVVSALSPEALERAVGNNLSSFKIPRLWYVTERMDEVPRTASDKVSKPGLRALIEKEGVRVGTGSDATPAESRDRS